MRTIHLFLLAFVLITTSCSQDDDVLLNQVPVVNAGASAAVTLPTNSYTFNGSAVDADGQVVGYLWSQLSGPEGAVIANPASISAVVTGLKQGTYVFQLMATDDDGATGIDTTSIVVSPAPITTLVLQPANNPNERQIASLGSADWSQSSSPDFAVEAWTNGGETYKSRILLKFDLSSIPANATIESATLSLSSFPTPTLNGNFVDANFGTTNAMLVQQVTSSWSPATANWSNQPSTTTANQVIVPTTAQSVLDLDLDVKSIVSSMVSNNANYGFFFKLQNETPYNCRLFVSSSNTTHTTKYPKLVVVYRQ